MGKSDPNMCMVKKNFSIEERVGKSNPNLELDLYISGLLDVCEFLIMELKRLMANEGRFFGIVKSYFDSFSDAYKIFNEKNTGEQMEVYGRILYLFKPLLRFEFKRLVRRGVSPADSDICLLHKILNILEEVENYEHRKELRTITKIVDKLFDNIRNDRKNDPLFIMADTIRTHINKRSLGKFALDEFRLLEEEWIKQPVTGITTKVSIQNPNKIVEIDL